MLNNAMIVIPCNIPWEWSTDYINQTAKILGKKNTVLCLFWLDACSLKEYIMAKKKPPIFFQKIEPGVLGYHFFHILPFRRWKIVHTYNIFINIQIVQLFCFFFAFHKKIQKKILWFFDPIAYPIVTAFPSFWFRLYDCVDYFRGDVLLSREQKNNLIRQENILLKTADVVCVNSHVLYKLHSPVRKDIHIVPQGFRLDTFMKHYSSRITLPKDKPIIGFIGAINYRLDYPLMVQVVKKMNHCRFVFVGPIQEEQTYLGKRWLLYAKRYLFSLPNVTVIYGVQKKEIKNIISQFDIGMIPYREDIGFNRYCYPMKLFEYFYMGKPVVSTSIEELKRFPKYVRIGGSPKDWEKCIKNILEDSWLGKYKKIQKQLAIENSWEEKVDFIMQTI